MAADAAPAVTPPDLLRLDGVRAGYGDVDVLRGVSVAVRAGEIVSIIGANGAGKSTVLRTIFGLVRPTAGSIRLSGREIAGASPREVLRLGCAYVPQGRCNFPAMTVEENLEMGAYTRGDAGVRGDVEALMRRFPILGERRRERAGALSGGQQQILEIAIALMLRPALLLVDEPSLGLDPRMVEVVFSTIVALNQDGVSVLMVEQNAKQALAISHAGFVLELGRNRFEGRGQDLLADPEVRQHYLGG